MTAILPGSALVGLALAAVLLVLGARAFALQGPPGRWLATRAAEAAIGLALLLVAGLVAGQALFTALDCIEGVKLSAHCGGRENLAMTWVTWISLMTMLALAGAGSLALALIVGGEIRHRRH